MEQNMRTYPNIAKSLDKLNILLFWEVLKTKNPYLLDGDYMENKKYTEEESKYIVNIWELMYDSYYQLKKDGRSKIVLQQSFDIMMLGQRINQLTDVLNLLLWLKSVYHHFQDAPDKENDVYRIALKSEPDLDIKYFEGIDANVEVFNKRLSALQNKYNRQNDNNEKEVAEQVDNVFTVIAKVSRIVGHRLDVHNMVVTEWLAYEQQARDMARAEQDLKKPKK